MSINKISIDGTTYIDLSQDDISSPNDIVAGKYAHLRSGERVLGTGQIGDTGLTGLTGKNVIFFGDSIGAGTGNNNHSFVDIIDEKGICASLIKECHASSTVGPYQPWEDASGYDLISMIQKRTSDIGNADIVFCEYGANDSYSLDNNLIQLGTDSDTSSATTIIGYVKRAFETIRTINPTVHIIWLFPVLYDFVNNPIQSYVNMDSFFIVTKAIINICNDNESPYFALYTGLKGSGHMVSDAASHPNEAGHQIIADNVIYGYPYMSYPYRPFKIVTLSSNGSYDCPYWKLALMIQENIDVVIKYNNLIFHPERLSSSSIIFKATSIENNSAVEYLLVLEQYATNLYTTTSALSSVSWQ